jgi:hypothetical protein
MELGTKSNTLFEAKEWSSEVVSFEVVQAKSGVLFFFT